MEAPLLGGDGMSLDGFVQVTGYYDDECQHAEPASVAYFASVECAYAYSERILMDARWGLKATITSSPEGGAA